MGEAKHTTREGKLKPRDFTDLDASLPQLEPCSPSSTLTTASLNPCLHLRTTPAAFPELLVPPPSWLERSVYYEDVLQGGGTSPLVPGHASGAGGALLGGGT